jgi:hypothetical protein
MITAVCALFIICTAAGARQQSWCPQNGLLIHGTVQGASNGKADLSYRCVILLTNYWVTN